MIILPKTDDQGTPYLSYSQISTWKKSKREYIRQYFMGESFEGNAYTDFGSKIGRALEENDFSEFTKKEQEFLSTIPRYDEFEREIKLQLNGFYVKGFIDTNTLVHSPEDSTKDVVVEKIADYKTGDIDKKRAEYESDSYTQLDIYAAAIQQETGHLPKNVDVFLIERLGNAFAGEELVLGNKFVTITKKVDEKRIKEVIAEVEAVAKEISEYYQAYLKLNKLI